MSRFNIFSLLLAGVFTAAALPSTLLINFETVPVEATGPTLFATAGPAQTIIVPGVATVTGGVILGNETNLPAQSFGTPPNVYATAGFGNSLSSTLAIAFNPAYQINEVSFPVFNGASIPESYLINAYNGSTVVASQTLSNLPANSSGGYAVADLTAAVISSVTISPIALNDPTVNGWDFSIDSVALNETVLQAFAPEPQAYLLILFGAVVTCFAIRRSKPSAANSLNVSKTGELHINPAKSLH